MFQSPVGYGNYVGEKFADAGKQLSRGACVHWAHEHSGSKLIAESLRALSKEGYKYVIAFSDDEAGEIGTLYQATNWVYLGKRTDTVTDFSILYVGTDRVFCDCRDLTRKLGFRTIKKAESFILDRPHLYLKPIKPKARYIRLLGSKKENREMLETLKSKILPYPKRAVEGSRESRDNTIIEGEGQFLNAAQDKQFSP
jgi:hypothetical protein